MDSLDLKCLTGQQIPGSVHRTHTHKQSNIDPSGIDQLSQSTGPTAPFLAQESGGKNDTLCGGDLPGSEEELVSESSSEDDITHFYTHNTCGQLKERLFLNLENRGRRNWKFLREAFPDLFKKQEYNRIVQNPVYGMEKLSQSVAEQRKARDVIVEDFIYNIKDGMAKADPKKKPITLAELTRMQRLDRLAEIHDDVIDLEQKIIGWLSGRNESLPQDIIKNVARPIMNIEQGSKLISKHWIESPTSLYRSPEQIEVQMAIDTPEMAPEVTQASKSELDGSEEEPLEHRIFYLHSGLERILSGLQKFLQEILKSDIFLTSSCGLDLDVTDVNKLIVKLPQRYILDGLDDTCQLLIK